MTAQRMLESGDYNPHFFAYGTFPFYVLMIVARIVSVFYSWLASYDGLFIVGRSISAILGAASVLTVWLIARAIYQEKRSAFFAAFLVAFNFFYLQLSRFFAFDIVLAAMCLGVIFCLIGVKKPYRWSHVLCVGLFFGLALATKISAFSLIIPVFVAAFFSELKHPDGYGFKGRILLFLGIVVFAFSVCILAEPYAVIDFVRFMHDTNEQMSLVKGLWVAPYTVQYQHTVA